MTSSFIFKCKMILNTLCTGTADYNLEWLRADGTIYLKGRVQAVWPQKILETGTLNVRFPVIWSSHFRHGSSGNFGGFGNPMVWECLKKLHLW